MKGLDNSWVPLVDYSLKQGISTSTIRRRIKAKKLKFKLHEGKYYIFCDPEEIERFEKETVDTEVLKQGLNVATDALHKLTDVTTDALKSKDIIIEAQTRKMRLLEEEIQDLKTLVTVLEEKNS